MDTCCQGTTVGCTGLPFVKHCIYEIQLEIKSTDRSWLVSNNLSYIIDCNFINALFVICLNKMSDRLDRPSDRSEYCLVTRATVSIRFGKMVMSRGLRNQQHARVVHALEYEKYGN